MKPARNTEGRVCLWYNPPPGSQCQRMADGALGWHGMGARWQFPVVGLSCGELRRTVGGAVKWLRRIVCCGTPVLAGMICIPFSSTNYCEGFQ